jgi:hypothetical protein
MAYVQKGARVGRDNRAAGSPAGRENLVNQVHSPAPEPPLEIGRYDTSTSASISRSSTTATVTATAHGMVVGDVVRVSGCVQKEYNGEFLVLSVADANTLTYQVFGSPATTATGTPLVRKVRRAAIVRDAS